MLALACVSVVTTASAGYVYKVAMPGLVVTSAPTNPSEPGEPEAPPVLTASLTAASLDFAGVDVGQTSAPKSVTLTNTGNRALTLLGKPAIQGSGDYSSTSDCGTSLAVGASCLSTVWYQPSATGVAPASQLSFNIQGVAPTPYVALTGTGTQALGELTAISGTSFGSVEAQTPAARGFTFKNTGNKPLSGVQVAAPAELAISNNSCGTAGAPVSLAANQSCSFILTWTPSGVSSTLSAQLSVASSAANGTRTLTLTGAATVPGVDALVVGGGGGGGSPVGGGGGGGAVLSTRVTPTAGVTYSIIVGLGGAAGPTISPISTGSNGGASSFGTFLTAPGGGGGGSGAGANGSAGLSGASGGGGYALSTGALAGGAGTAGQGYAGAPGTVISGSWGSPGGGGGAGGPGYAGTATNAGAGGPGLASSITGVSVKYGGGGGGGGFGDQGRLGGNATDGGGRGSQAVGPGTPGTPNTGGGGGGGNWYTGGKLGAPGGSGVVILSFPTFLAPALTGTYTSSLNGAYTVVKFTANGTIRF